jgi:hypothetical protein
MVQTNPGKKLDLTSKVTRAKKTGGVLQAFLLVGLKH